MAMTPKSFITGISGDTEVADTLAIAAPRALYAVAFGSKPKKNPPELLPPSSEDCVCGIRLKKIEDGKAGKIINRSHGSTYLDEKSVLTSGATPNRVVRKIAAQHLAEPPSLFRNRFVHLSPQLLFDGLQTGSKPVSSSYPPKQKPAFPILTTNVSEA